MTSLKKKYTQNDLRRLMAEQKAKSAPKKTTTTINSPLAKYNDLGQLMCLLCKTVVRSEDVWKVHINAKQHKQNVELAKKSANSMPPPPVPSAQSSSAATASKRRMAPPPIPEVPAKIPKGILKNSPSHKPNNSSSQVADAKPTTTSTENSALPDNFFDDPPQNANFYEATLTKTTIKTNLISIKRNPDPDKMDDTNAENSNAEQLKDETLPEGFFDDPIKDAKARNSEYKDPVEEEWEKFQQEIKAASDFSNAIIAEDQEEAITERQIDEIDEQIRNWNRVLELEKMKETVNDKSKESDITSSCRTVTTAKIRVKQKKEPTPIESSDDDDDDNEVDDIDEYLDWRSKKAYK
ncbi:zinc finger protein 830 [Contarinia nasturtii]|uniref:zinc finger protein 830 n=1 Tax=Contarinia nasturtii TaxID=265458 RepID=UPI0012D4C2D6|nr:zinc finger protein 830 [Contarinia nasturtii]